MKKVWFYFVFLLIQLSLQAQSKAPEDYYVYAFNEMSDMLAGRDSLSIKRAVFLAEWAFYEGKLDYKTDFCDEIDRITKYINLFYDVNNLQTYKTGMQMAISSYMVDPLSGNDYTSYTYDFDTLSMDNDPWEQQFVSRTLKTHKGQCRSLPWMYKILANELHADVALAQAPRHSYIMYKDEDNITPEEWINLELTANAMNPSWWIKQEFEICDSAVIVGTYMTPLTDTQTVACQIADLAFGYKEKFQRYDKFTYYCASRSLEFYPMNPTAWIIRGKSLERIIQDYLKINGHIIDDYAAYLLRLMEETKRQFDNTYMTEETEEIRERRKQQAIEAQKNQEISLSK
ncbi:MAG: hypothetical protein HDT09_02810 [Bacteroidales bacterium]|nr:hypothetical protein [Bacteroidales bacterium]